VELHSAGEDAMMLYLGEETSPEVSARVQAAVSALEEALGDDLVDLVPSYASLLIIYDPMTTDHLSVAHRVKQALAFLRSVSASEGRSVVLPVYYAPAAPRLATPRQKVPRGAVAIADRQTAVYPAVSPGGWNLIGRCPVRMFDPDARPTMPVTVGDRVRFEPISRDRFLAMGGEL
jgi:allophanate hydrolase subunit 1